MAEDNENTKDRKRTGVDERSQRNKYGGFNFGAAFFGWLVATGVAVLLTALLFASGSAIALTAIKGPHALSKDLATVGVASGLLLLIDLGLSYYAGGYVAGRMSRFDGGRQGIGVWVMGLVITLILGGIGAGLGAKYNLLQQINLPHIPVNQDSFTKGGLITFLLILVVTLLAALLGGKTGQKYHRRVDRAGVTND